MSVVRIIGFIAAAWALLVGLWGIVNHGAVESTPGDLQSAILWLGMGISALAVAAAAGLVVATRRT